MKRALLLSNSTNPGETYLASARRVIADFLGTGRNAIFVPYAGVRISYDEYTQRVRDALEPLGIHITSVHEVTDPVRAIAEAEAVIVGGGNTFRLLSEMYATSIVAESKRRVEAGVPFVGWSAGSNVACPGIYTTNDMPIVEPPTLRALGIVPFQINPHFTDARLPDHGGETRTERIEEFLVLNPDVRVVGLPEGTWLRIEGEEILLQGKGEAVLFRAGRDPEVVAIGSRLDPLMAI